jgi:hypothetical protein
MRFSPVHPPLFLGALLAWSFLAVDLPGQRVLRTHSWPAPPNRTGGILASIGDLNGDGVPEYADGTRYARNGGPESGAVRIYSGGTGEVLHLLPGLAPGDWFGSFVNPIDDLNADGIPDFLVGAPLSDVNGEDSGSAYAYSGADASILLHLVGDQPGDMFGRWGSSAGDVDADGIPDIVIGSEYANNYTGRVSVHSGVDGSLIWEWSDLSPYYWTSGLGWWVTDAGDVDSDGHADVAACSAGSDFFVFSGRTGAVLRHYSGSWYTIENAGDLDLDGFDDLIASSPGSWPGFVEAFSGRDGSRLFLVEEDWNEVTSTFGRRACDGIGDTNGDGVPDLIIGSYQSSRNGGNSGWAGVFSGSDGSEIFEIIGDQPGDGLGFFASGGGDIDQDGCSDILMGAIQFGASPRGPGYLRIYAGDPNPLHLGSPTPGLASSLNQLIVTGVRPRSGVIFFAGTSPGMTRVPAGHGGMAVVNIQNALFSGIFAPNPQGEVIGQWFVPSAYYGLTVRLQVVEWNTGRFSNLVEHMFL